MSFAELGYAVVPAVLDDEDIASLVLAFAQSDATHARGGQPFANRQALSNPAIAQLAKAMAPLAARVLERPFAVRAILFDKVEGANWKVPWHQDLTIAVKHRAEVSGYGPWSIKEGIEHVQPPSEVLESMLALRLHLDDCGSENGPLRVLPGTYLRGRMKQEAVDEQVKSLEPVKLTCTRGDAILMSPLLLHASSPATSPHHRRVVHIEYAACELAEPLEWAYRVTN